MLLLVSASLLIFVLSFFPAFSFGSYLLRKSHPCRHLRRHFDNSVSNGASLPSGIRKEDRSYHRWSTLLSRTGRERGIHSPCHAPVPLNVRSASLLTAITASAVRLCRQSGTEIRICTFPAMSAVVEPHCKVLRDEWSERVAIDGLGTVRFGCSEGLAARLRPRQATQKTHNFHLERPDIGQTNRG
jgi:hypothetical protein